MNMGWSDRLDVSEIPQNDSQTHVLNDTAFWNHANLNNCRGNDIAPTSRIRQVDCEGSTIPGILIGKIMFCSNFGKFHVHFCPICYTDGKIPSYDFSRPRFNVTISDCLLSTTQKAAP